MEVDQERDLSLKEIATLQKRLLEQIDFFKYVYSELEVKKRDLLNGHAASKSYLGQEMQTALEEFR